MFVSPTEPKPFHRMSGAKISMYSEQFGCDFLITVAKLKPTKHFIKVGVQRKEIKDLFASAENGRLGEQLKKMGPLDVKVLIVEGQIRSTSDGAILLDRSGHGSNWTIDAFHGLMFSCQMKGLWVLYTKSITDTIEMLNRLEAWMRKEKHNSLDVRPKAKSALWGTTPTDREFACHVLQSVPGVGADMAGNVFDRFGLPLMWTVSVEELMTVPGIGRKTAEKMIKALGEE